MQPSAAKYFAAFEEFIAADELRVDMIDNGTFHAPGNICTGTVNSHCTSVTTYKSCNWVLPEKPLKECRGSGFGEHT